MSELQWSERYNCHHARVGRFALDCNWSSSASKDEPHGYNVSFAGTRLKKPVPSLDDAKAAGIRLAHRLLTEALAALPKVPR